MLRDQLGLVLTPEHRNIEMLVIRLGDPRIMKRLAQERSDL
jgi:hypothetical protein